MSDLALSTKSQVQDSQTSQSPRFPGVSAPLYIPLRHVRGSCHGMAPPVTIRNSVPCYSAPPVPRAAAAAPPVMRTAPPVKVAPQVCIRKSVPVFSAPPVKRDDSATATLEEPDKVSDKVKQIQDPTSKESEESQNSEVNVKPFSLPFAGPSMTRVPPVRTAPSVCIRQAVPVFSMPPSEKDDIRSIELKEPDKNVTDEGNRDSEAVKKLEELKL